MKIKTCPARIKAAGTQDGTEDGVFEAIVATYDVDSVGDKIKPGAFAETLEGWRDSGDPIPVLWSHMSHDPDYHIGYVEQAEEREEGLWVRARIDLDEPKAGKVYKLLKGKRVRQFSFAYDVAEGGWVEDEKDAHGGYFELRKLHLFEVGPTLIGANQETELLAVKSGVRGHTTSTSDEAWDGPANERRLPNDAGQEVYRAAFAWLDPDGDPDRKNAYKFIHHFVDSDGNVGAASTEACTAGIAVLNGARSGTTIPDGDRQSVYNHLARHLSDADIEPPELKSVETVQTSRRTRPTARKAGRVLSGANEETLRGALDKITEATTAINQVLSALDDDADGDDEDDDGGTAPDEQQTDKATPRAQHARSTRPPKTAAAPDAPARQGTASLRLRNDLDLLALEVDRLTN